MKTTKAIFFAILAAILYSLMTPVSKLMQISVPPVAEAGLLYLGAGIGMTIIYLIEQKAGKEQMRPSVGKEDLKYVIAMDNAMEEGMVVQDMAETVEEAEEIKEKVSTDADNGAAGATTTEGSGASRLRNR